MSAWWYVLIVVVLVALIALTLRSRRHRARLPEPDASSSHDFVDAREGTRRAHMSETDRAWEDASLQRHRDASRREDAHASPSPTRATQAAPSSPEDGRATAERAQQEQDRQLETGEESPT